MSQISPPIRIALVGALAFLAVWFVALKPKPVDDVAATPPASAPAAPSTAAPAPATAAPSTAAPATAAPAPVTGAPATAAPAPATAAPATAAPAPATAEDAALATLPAAVRQALSERKVLVSLFWNGGRSADDRAAHRAVRATDRRGGRVVVHEARIDDVAEYSAVTLGATVVQSPTIVVVDANRKVETLVGYSDAAAVEQAVVDALAAGR